MRSLVISSDINSIKYNSYFSSLGTEVFYIVLNQERLVKFNPFIEHRFWCEKTMFFVNSQDNLIEAHKSEAQKNNYFIESLRSLFFERPPGKKQIDFSSKVSEIVKPLEYLDKNDLLDIKYDGSLSKMQIEFKNKGLVGFDHVFIEKSDSVLSFLQSKNKDLVKSRLRYDFSWVCYSYKLSGHFTSQDFWLIDSSAYKSVFDNVFYLQERDGVLSVWALIPQHQVMNHGFHDKFKSRIQEKIEKKFNFMTLSFIQVEEDNVHFMPSHKYELNEKKCFSGFPCFALYSESEVRDWFSRYGVIFNKNHKIKEGLSL